MPLKKETKWNFLYQGHSKSNAPDLFLVGAVLMAYLEEGVSPHPMTQNNLMRFQ